jgi:subfamily B ATP-binding cassette protein HlyB/CyaB
MAEVITDRSNLFALANIAQAFGFTAKPYDLNFSSLAKIGMPCIAQCKGNHFVVVYEVSEENIWIADPIHGKAKLYKGEFIRNWNGIVLSVTPNPEIISPKDLNEPELFYFKEHKSLLARIYAPLLSFLKR